MAPKISEARQAAATGGRRRMVRVGLQGVGRECLREEGAERIRRESEGDIMEQLQVERSEHLWTERH